MPKNIEQRKYPTYFPQLHNVHNSSEIFPVYVNYIAHKKTSEYFSIQTQVHVRYRKFSIYFSVFISEDSSIETCS